MSSQLVLRAGGWAGGDAKVKRVGGASTKEGAIDAAKLVRAARAGDDAKVKRLLKAKVDANSMEGRVTLGRTSRVLAN